MLFFLSVLLSCSTTPNTEIARTLSTNSPLQKTAWLLGHWRSPKAEVQVAESWLVVSDTLIEGVSCFLKDTDTLSSQNIRLEIRGSHILYTTAQLKSFMLTLSTENTLVFENFTDDFPQKICYKNISQDSIQTELTGVLNGQPKQIQFMLGKTQK